LQEYVSFLKQRHEIRFMKKFRIIHPNLHAIAADLA